MSHKWEQLNSNQVLDNGGEFFISYVPNTEIGHMNGALTELGNMLGADLKDGEETALVIRRPANNFFMILEGDYRKEYEAVFDQGLNACKAVFNRHQDHRSNWSTDDALL